jgi:hypothetical protein
MGDNESDNKAILAHWHYEPGEWEHFIVSEWAKVQSQLKRFVYGFALVLLAVPIFVAGVIFLSSGSLGAPIGVVILEILAIVVWGGIALTNYNAKRRWLALLRTVSPEIVVTSDFVVYGGADYLIYPYHQIQPLWRIVRTRTETEADGPQTIWIEISYAVARNYGEAFRIPVPHGHENEGVAVAGRLQGR